VNEMTQDKVEIEIDGKKVTPEQFSEYMGDKPKKATEKKVMIKKAEPKTNFGLCPYCGYISVAFDDIDIGEDKDDIIVHWECDSCYELFDQIYKLVEVIKIE